MCIRDSACSGGEPAAAPQTTAVVVETTTSTTAAPTTVAPVIDAPTTVAPVNEAPSSLAFASTADIGRLFEVDGSAQVLDAPAGDFVTTLPDGALVQAGAARNVDDSLMVGIIDPTNPGVSVGWVVSTSLRPTTQVVTTTDPALTNQLRQVFRVPGTDGLGIVAAPGSSSVVGTLGHREIAVYNGTNSIASDGSQWSEVIDPNTGAPLGWIPARNAAEFRGNSAQDRSFNDTDRRPDSSTTYGSSLATGQISVVGCNATQIEFQNGSSQLGMALLFGTQEPVGVTNGVDQVWTGSELFVAPGDTLTLTLETDAARTWHVVGLGQDLLPQSTAQGGGQLQAVGVQTFSLPSGTCSFVPSPLQAGIDSGEYTSEFGPSEEEIAARAAEREQELADAEALAANELAAQEESEETLPTDEAADPGASTDDTTTTESASTDDTTTAPPVDG